MCRVPERRRGDSRSGTSVLADPDLEDCEAPALLQRVRATQGSLLTISRQCAKPSLFRALGKPFPIHLKAVPAEGLRDAHCPQLRHVGVDAKF